MGNKLFIGSDNKVRFNSFGVGELSSTGTINDGQWRHVTVTFVDNLNTVAFYIDGGDSGGGTFNLPADGGGANNVVKIGGDPDGNCKCWRHSADVVPALDLRDPAGPEENMDKPSNKINVPPVECLDLSDSKAAKSPIAWNANKSVSFDSASNAAACSDVKTPGLRR